MGFSHSTYHFYGVHVPREHYHTDHQQRECEFIDATIKHTPELAGSDVGHITAGDYDRDELFLCVVPEGDYVEVDLGGFRVCPVIPTEEVTGWYVQLNLLIEALGYKDVGQIGWYVVPDIS